MFDLDLIKNKFNEIYFLIYGQEYKFGNKSVEKTLKSFSKNLNESYGENWLMDFMIFQFTYYDGMKTRFDRIYLNWIFGDKAFKRWNNRTEQQIYFSNIFKSKLGIKECITPVSIKDYKNLERSRFISMGRQFIHCDELFLFKENNDICLICDMYNNCLKHYKSEL